MACRCGSPKESESSLPRVMVVRREGTQPMPRRPSLLGREDPPNPGSLPHLPFLSAQCLRKTFDRSHPRTPPPPPWLRPWNSRKYFVLWGSVVPGVRDKN